MPGTSTRVTTSVSVTSRTRTATLPSSISRRSPGAQSPGRPLKVVPTSSFVPGTSRVVMVKVSPMCSSWGAVLEGFQTDLRALEINENRNRAAGRRRRLSHTRNDGRMFLSLSMRRLIRANIHAGVHQRLELLRRFSGRSNSADNLSSTHGCKFTAQSRGNHEGPTRTERDHSHE